MSQIRITPAELRSLASTLMSNATEVQALANSIKTNVVSKTEGWEGKSKNRYISSFNEIYPTLSTKLPDLLQALAKDLNQTATNFESVDR